MLTVSPQTDYITYRQASERYPSVDQRAIKRWVASGALPIVRERGSDQKERVMLDAARLAQLISVDGRKLPPAEPGVSRFSALPMPKPANS